MTFKEYCNITADSVRSQGYDSFYPSMCLPGDEIRMMVLDGPLSECGEEAIAKEWAAQFDSKVKYLAYRCGHRRVSICHIVDNDVKDRVWLAVESA